MPFDLQAFFDETFADCIRGEEDLRDEQQQAIKFAWERPFSALFLDVGVGKTVVSLTIMDRLLMRGYLGKFLIIAPIRVATRVWPFEPRLWRQLAYMRMLIEILRVADDDSRLAAAWDHGLKIGKEAGHKAKMRQMIAQRMKTARKTELMAQLIASDKPIHIINQEAVPWLCEQFEGKVWPYQVIFWDESSRLGDHNSEAFKAMKKLLPFIKRFHQLTATPASQTYMKLFAQIYLLDRGERFGKDITTFRGMYFDHNHYAHTYKLRKGAAEEIERKIADICLVIRRDKNFTVSVRPVRLSTELAAQYQQFERDLVLELPEATIDGVNQAVLSNKLLQYASGSVYDRVVELNPVTGDPKERKVYYTLHDEKIDDLKSLIEETLDEPVMVAYWYKSSLERLKAAFPQAVVMDREGKLEATWNKRKHKMMLVHPMGVAHGMNLQHGGHHVAVFDIFWRLDLFTQLIGRLDRPGQSNTVRVHLLTTIGTMDETVSRNLEQLRGAEDAMFRRLRQLWERHHAG